MERIRKIKERGTLTLKIVIQTDVLDKSKTTIFFERTSPSDHYPRNAFTIKINEEDARWMIEEIAEAAEIDLGNYEGG